MLYGEPIRLPVTLFFALVTDLAVSTKPTVSKPLYSLALYEQYLEDYEIQLGDYRDSMEELASVDLDL